MAVTELANRPTTAAAVVAPRQEFDRAQIEIIKDTVAQGTSDTELALFLATCQRTGLDPIARQIYAIMRWNGRAKRDVMTIQTAIDGYRLIAERSGRYQGQVETAWCGPDGEWKTVWASDEPPFAARAGVYKEGFVAPVIRVAHWAEYAQTDKDGNPSPMWARMPRLMLAKCAEALAIRAAFPQETSGVYTAEEMAQAEVIDIPAGDDPAEHRRLLDAIEEDFSSCPEDQRKATLEQVLAHAQFSVGHAKAVLAKIAGWMTPPAAADVDDTPVDVEPKNEDTAPAPHSASVQERWHKALMAAFTKAKVDEDQRHWLCSFASEGRTSSSRQVNRAEQDRLHFICNMLLTGGYVLTDAGDNTILQTATGEDVALVDIDAARKKS